MGGHCINHCNRVKGEQHMIYKFLMEPVKSGQSDDGLCEGMLTCLLKILAMIGRLDFAALRCVVRGVVTASLAHQLKGRRFVNGTWQRHVLESRLAVRLLGFTARNGLQISQGIRH